jgi:hypothetical protein
MSLKTLMVVLWGVMFFALPAQAGFLVEVDTDGLDDGILTYNPDFSFGGDTTTASQSVASNALGMTGGDSIFGGDGVSQPDTYIITYNPAAEVDNLALAAGSDLGAGNTASGLVGGGAGLYNVYATWPFTANVGGGPTRYTISTDGHADLVSLVDQNGTGDVWVFLNTLDYSSGDIVVTQQPSGSNTFVSMRLAGVLFEAVPEPSTVVLLMMGALALIIGWWRRKWRA